MEYSNYIGSTAWRDRRNAYFARHPRSCRRCHSQISIELHHASYARMGNEPDEDLVPLCPACHKFVHRLHGLTRLDLRIVTLAALAKQDAPAPGQRPKPSFVPARHRLSFEERRSTPLSGAEGRLGGIPIVT